MTPKQFLIIGGIVLILLGVFGFLFPNPLGDISILHFDIYENFTHTILGIAAIIFAFALPNIGRWWITLLVGITGLLFGILGLALIGQSFPNLGGANLENPVDNVIHLAVGIWGFAVVYFNRSMLSRRTKTREAEKMKRAA